MLDNEDTMKELPISHRAVTILVTVMWCLKQTHNIDTI